MTAIENMLTKMGPDLTQKQKRTAWMIELMAIRFDVAPICMRKRPNQLVARQSRPHPPVLELKKDMYIFLSDTRKELIYIFTVRRSRGLNTK